MGKDICSLRIEQNGAKIHDKQYQLQGISTDEIQRNVDM